MGTPNGYTVVLAADRALMADYRLLFDGILACSQTTTTLPPVVRPCLLPRARAAGTRAEIAPLGLRRIEAALVRNGFTRDEVAVVDGDHLRQAVGPATRVVGVSTGDPTGLGMSTTTVCAITGGTGIPQVMFGKLMKKVRRAVLLAGGGARVVAGGPGVWQLVQHPETREALGISHVITGYAEGNVADLFRALGEGEDLPGVVLGENVPAAQVPPILGASTMGVVEISRGCGLGCPFCTIARTPMEHLPQETVVSDAETNVAAGQTDVCAISEDLFRYGAEGLRARPRSLIALLARLREIDGLGLIQTDHGNVASMSQYTDAELAEVRALLVGPTGQEYPWINIGVETASGALLKANGCAAKMAPFAEHQWADACAAQLNRLCRAGFFPMASIVIGLPGETTEDTRRTLEWVESVAAERLAVFPVLYAPIDGRPPVTARSLTRSQWRLIKTCYKLNFKWIPRMYWDNQRAAGAGLTRRLVMRALGYGQIALWTILLALRSRGSRDAADD